MAVLDTIQEKIRTQEYEFTIPHFFEEMADDDLIFDDIEMAIAHAKSDGGLPTINVAPDTKL